MYRKHSFETKLNLVSKLKNGVPFRELSQSYQIDMMMLREWVRKYDLHGEQGLKKQSSARTTGQIKEALVRKVVEELIPLPLVTLEYEVSRSALKSWIRLVKQHGYTILYQQNIRGRPPANMRKSKNVEPKTELEKLQAENERLRAENALLKKVKALVEEREARERMTGQKPSKN
jgi:transposase